MKTFREWWKEGSWNRQDSHDDCEQAWNEAQAQDTPPKPQHGREPKPLAQYLAEQLIIEVDYYVAWCAWIQQTLNAYESTENVMIQIIKKKER